MIFPNSRDKTTLGKAFTEIKKWGYSDLPADAVWKWSKILKSFDDFFPEYNSKNLKILDVGGGLSFLHLYFSQFGEVTNVDILGFEKTWFPTDDFGIYKNASNYARSSINKKNIKYIKNNFFDFIKTVDDNYFDLVVDGCSIIHFDRKFFTRKDHSIYLVGKEISRTLKERGKFFTSTHIAHPKSFEYRDMFFIERIIKGYSISGLSHKYDEESLILFGELNDISNAQKKTIFEEDFNPLQCCERNKIGSSRPNIWLNCHLVFENITKQNKNIRLSKSRTLLSLTKALTIFPIHELTLFFQLLSRYLKNLLSRNL